MGYVYYQQRRYELARGEYEQVQGIDPDDLAAHYQLSLIYRRLGMKEKAAWEAARFADQKDDPSAPAYALEYLRNHTEIANETVPWHVHELDASSSAPVTGGGSE
jgi:tetratricopeptide (TPR) repeat protein